MRRHKSATDFKFKPYLPTPPSRSPLRRGKNSQIPSIRIEKPKTRSGLNIRTFLRTQLFALIYLIVHTIFSVHIRLRQAYHALRDRILAILFYHHRTPEFIRKDVKGLSRLPKHLSVILKLEDGRRGGAGLEALVDEVAEISAWCACVGIPTLSVYEKTGSYCEMLVGVLLTRIRDIERVCSGYTQSSLTKTLLLPWIRSSRVICGSASYPLHGISLKYTNSRHT